MKNVKGGKGNTKSELIEGGEITNLRESKKNRRVQRERKNESM